MNEEKDLTEECIAGQAPEEAENTAEPETAPEQEPETEAEAEQPEIRQQVNDTPDPEELLAAEKDRFSAVEPERSSV